MRIAGLTGGTGSGKSVAARRFEKHGIPVIDADRVGHSLIAPGGRAEAAVWEAFGQEIGACGIIDRDKLGSVVFSDREALSTLNRIVRPLLIEEIGARCADHADAGRPVCLVDAALLGEGGTLEPWLDALVLVLCPEPIRLQRLMNGRGMDEARARRQMASQTDPERKRALARWIIQNDGSLDWLHQQVDAVAGELLQGRWNG